MNLFFELTVVDFGRCLLFTCMVVCAWFLPCDAMRCTVLVIVILSVRPSVTLVHCVHMVRSMITISSPYGSPIILVFGDITIIPKFEGITRARALNEGGVGMNWRFSTNKPLHLRNDARYDKGYYWSLIGNQIRAFHWYQNQRPWSTMKWPWTAIVALHTCLGVNH